MARKTKAQYLAEQKAQEAQLEQEACSKYPGKLMHILGRATNLGFELTVKNSMFNVTRYNDNISWAMPMLYTKAGQYVLEQLTWEIESEESARLEEENRAKAKAVALSKLTKEERELLGL